MPEPDLAFATLDPDNGERFQALRRDLGVSSFGMNLIVLRRGQRGRIHAHERQEEVYLVLEGELTLLVEGAEHAGRDGRAWTSWDEGGEGRAPQEVPMPEDLPA
jgi:uncharacterized cupin superfamily protein